MGDIGLIGPEKVVGKSPQSPVSEKPLASKTDILARQALQNKTREAEELIFRLGAPRDADNPNTNILDALMRLSMRMPSNDMQKKMGVLHQKMRNAFAGLSDEALEWLYGGSADAARGGFKNVQKMRDFLNSDPSKLDSSALVTGMETILAAMGYRSICASWVREPFTPETSEQKKMYTVLQELMQKHLVSTISSAYLERSSIAIPETVPPTKAEVVGEKRGYISEASAGEEAPIPKKLPRARFRAMPEAWPSIAVASGVGIRANVSGTCPLEAAAMAGLLADERWFQDDEEARNFITFMTVPSFHRGDYHSIAETYAGVNFFLHQRAEKESRSSFVAKRPVIDPRNAIKKALNILQSGVAKEIQEDYNLVFQNALQKIRKGHYGAPAPKRRRVSNY